MIKHVKVAYTQEIFGDEEEFFSSSTDYETEEELEAFIKQMDNSDEIKSLHFVPGKIVKIYTQEEYIKELENRVLSSQIDYDRFKEVNYYISNNKTMRHQRNSNRLEDDDFPTLEKPFEPQEGMLSKLVIKGESKYYNGKTEITKSEYELLSKELENDSYIRALKRCIDRTLCKRIISRMFDLSKLSVNDYDECVKKLIDVKTNNYSQYLEELKELFPYALIKE